MTAPLGIGIAGQAQTRSLVADEFLRYADILASLSRDEIIAVASLHRIRKEIDARPGGRELYGHTIWERLKEELVPSLAQSDDHLRALVTGAMRSGLIISLTAFDDIGFFTTSPGMDHLEKLASFNEALEAEPEAQKVN